MAPKLLKLRTDIVLTKEFYLFNHSETVINEAVYAVQRQSLVDFILYLYQSRSLHCIQLELELNSLQWS